MRISRQTDAALCAWDDRHPDGGFGLSIFARRLYLAPLRAHSSGCDDAGSPRPNAGLRLSAAGDSATRGELHLPGGPAASPSTSPELGAAPKADRSRAGVPSPTPSRAGVFHSEAPAILLPAATGAARAVCVWCLVEAGESAYPSDAFLSPCRAHSPRSYGPGSI
jgi:hypothetical protein